MRQYTGGVRPVQTSVLTLGRVAGKLPGKFVREVSVVLLEGALDVGVRVGHGDHRVALCAHVGTSVSG